MESREERHATTISRAVSGHVSAEANAPLGEREIKIERGKLCDERKSDRRQKEGKMFAIRREGKPFPTESWKRMMKTTTNRSSDMARVDA